MAEQPADGQDVLSLHDGDAGVCVAKIVKPDIPQTCIRTDAVPEVIDSACGDGIFGSG